MRVTDADVLRVLAEYSSRDERWGGTRQVRDALEPAPNWWRLAFPSLDELFERPSFAQVLIIRCGLEEKGLAASRVEAGEWPRRRVWRCAEKRDPYHVTGWQHPTIRAEFDAVNLRPGDSVDVGPILKPIYERLAAEFNCVAKTEG